MQQSLVVVIFWFISKCTSQCNYAHCEEGGDCPVSGLYAVGYCNSFAYYAKGIVLPTNGHSFEFKCIRPSDGGLPKAVYYAYDNSYTCSGTPSSNYTVDTEFACDLECQPPCDVFEVEYEVYNSSDFECKWDVVQVNTVYLTNYDLCYKLGSNYESVLVSDQGYNWTAYANSDCTGTPTNKYGRVPDRCYNGLIFGDNHRWFFNTESNASSGDYDLSECEGDTDGASIVGMAASVFLNALFVSLYFM